MIYAIDIYFYNKSNRRRFLSLVAPYVLTALHTSIYRALPAIKRPYQTLMTSLDKKPQPKPHGRNMTHRMLLYVPLLFCRILDNISKLSRDQIILKHYLVVGKFHDWRDRRSNIILRMYHKIFSPGKVLRYQLYKVLQYLLRHVTILTFSGLYVNIIYYQRYEICLLQTNDFIVIK